MKKPISATIDEELIGWMDNSVNANKKYRNKSHLIETALEILKSREEQDAAMLKADKKIGNKEKAGKKLIKR